MKKKIIGNVCFFMFCMSLIITINVYAEEKYQTEIFSQAETEEDVHIKENEILNNDKQDELNQETEKEYTGEKYENGSWYYYLNGEKVVNQFVNLPDGRTVYYQMDGTMVYGEQAIDGNWYYFDNATGAMESRDKFCIRLCLSTSSRV